MQAVDYEQLGGDLEKLAAGGEGIVYRIPSRPHLVFKEYKEAQRPTLDVPALARLVGSLDTMGPADRSRIATRTAWPRHLVVKQGQVLGFLMPAIEPDFYRNYGLRSNPKRVLCDWNQLIYQNTGPLPSHMVSDIPTPAVGERLSLLRDLATTVQVLHSHDIVVGDMSGKNLLWRLQPATVFFIDCDSFRPSGERGACTHKESPGWVDPALGGGPTTKDSDIYKLGVAAYRSLWADPSGSVSSQGVLARASASVPAEFRDLVASSVASSGRPTAADWKRYFDDVDRFGGRPKVTAGHSAPQPSSGKDAGPSQGGWSQSAAVDPTPPVSAPSVPQPVSVGRGRPRPRLVIPKLASG